MFCLKRVQNKLHQRIVVVLKGFAQKRGLALDKYFCVFCLVKLKILL